MLEREVYVGVCGLLNELAMLLYKHKGEIR